MAAASDLEILLRIHSRDSEDQRRQMGSWSHVWQLDPRSEGVPGSSQDSRYCANERRIGGENAQRTNYEERNTTRQRRGANRDEAQTDSSLVSFVHQCTTSCNLYVAITLSFDCPEGTSGVSELLEDAVACTSCCRRQFCTWRSQSGCLPLQSRH